MEGLGLLVDCLGKVLQGVFVRNRRNYSYNGLESDFVVTTLLAGSGYKKYFKDQARRLTNTLSNHKRANRRSTTNRQPPVPLDSVPRTLNVLGRRTLELIDEEALVVARHPLHQQRHLFLDFGDGLGVHVGTSDVLWHADYGGEKGQGSVTCRQLA